MRLLACALFGGLAACFDPTQLDGVLACGPPPDPCPPGMECRADAHCWLPSSPASSTPDAPPVTSETPDAPMMTSPPDAKPPPHPDAKPPPPPAPDARLPACSDGIDNDCDGLTDWPDDPGCSGPDDDDEHGTLECDDGIDNDHDGKADFHIGTRCGPGDDNCKDVHGKEKGGPGPGPPGDPGP